MAGTRTAIAAGVLSAALAGPATGQRAPDCGLSDLAWMAGEWAGESDGVAMTETWTDAEGGVMLGLHRDVLGPDRAFFEFLRIAPDSTGTPVYHASPRGRPAVPFRSIGCDASRAVFENPGHDYPQRIVYARDGEALVARIEGEEGGETRSSEWRYALVGGGSTGGSSDREADRAALLDLQSVERRAHLEKDPDLLASFLADDFTSVSGGRVERPSRESWRERFAAYVESVEFIAWDDVEPPAIRISEDGSMAWVLVQKRVRLVPADAPDAQPEHTLFAWTETWEKRAGEWRLTSVTSTDRPGGATDGASTESPSRED